MVVFIGRSIEQASNTAEKLNILGFQTHVDPLFERVVLDAQWVDLPYTHIIFTSQNAVLSYCDSHFPKHIPCITVGSKTKAIAEQNGFAVIHNAQGAVKDIIHYIDAHCQNALLLYPTTEDAKADLELYLQRTDIHYHKLLLYKMRAYSSLSKEGLVLFKKKEIEYVCFYSQKSAETFFEILSSHKLFAYLGNIVFLCLYSPVENSIPSQFRAQIIVTKTPDESSLFDMLQKLAKNRNISIHKK